jgi:hypothetical protein
MGIKGLPEQLKHYYRDAQVEQFKGAPRFSFHVVVCIAFVFQNFSTLMSLLSLCFVFFLKFQSKLNAVTLLARARLRDVHHR